VLAHLLHGELIAFHEAAHGTLCPNRALNDAVGMLIGTPSLMSLSLFRAAHHSHHAYLATERDEELWPFVVPGTPRWARLLAAAAELGLGLLFTPALFLRAFLRHGTLVRNPALRRRIWLELALSVVLLGGMLAAVAWLGVWRYWVLVYLVPAWLAGCMQSLRKYIEHVGLTGATVVESTRTVVAPGPVGRLLSWSLMNEPFHGVHHRYARLPQDALPEFAPLLAPSRPGQMAPFPNYRSALWDLLRTVPDPRVGAQWLWNERAVRGTRAGARGPLTRRANGLSSRPAERVA
jgi:fatty acid desaturase